jgi:hypothetical protein
VSYKVLPSAGIITFGDGAYFHNVDTSWRNIATTLSPNYLGQDQSNTVLNYAPRVAVIFLLKIFHLSDNAIAYLMFFGLFFAASLVYYLVFYDISRNFYFGILAGLFVVLNNLSIETIAFGGAFYYYLGLISFGLLISLMWKIYRQKRLSIISIVLIILASLFIVQPFYFVIYGLIAFLFLLWCGWQWGFWKNLWKYGATLLGIIVVHSYWLLPFIFGSLRRGPQATYGGNLDAVFMGFKSVASYVNAIDFFQYFDFFSRNFHQTIFHYIFYIGIVFLLVLTAFFFKKTKKRSLLLFLFILYLLFFNLALGPASNVFGAGWMFLWDHISWFSFFRSFSRFLIIIIPIYLFYFAVLNSEWESKYKNRIYILLCIVILMLNIDMFTGNLRGSIVTINIPKEYAALNSYFVNDNAENNIIAFPDASYESYQWSINENTKLIQQDYYLKDYLFTKPIIYDRTALSLYEQNNIFSDVFSMSPNFSNLDDNLSQMNVRYVLVQKDLLNIFSLKSVDYSVYEKYFSADPHYSLLEDNQYFDLYRYDDQASQIESPNSYFEEVNSTEYRIYLENISKNQALTLLQNYNSNWYLYLHSNPSLSWCQPDANFEDTQTTECANNKNFFGDGDLSYLWKEPIFDNTHVVANDYANGWTIDPNYIKQNFGPSYYKENPDGSIDIELTLYYKPQSYFNLGLIVSGATLLACLGYLGWEVVRRKKKKLVATTTIKKEEDI